MFSKGKTRTNTITGIKEQRGIANYNGYENRRKKIAVM